MKALQNIRIGTRLTLGFIVVLALMVCLTVIGVIQVNKIDTDLTEINEGEQREAALRDQLSRQRA